MKSGRMGQDKVYMPRVPIASSCCFEESCRASKDLNRSCSRNSVPAFNSRSDVYHGAMRPSPHYLEEAAPERFRERLPMVGPVPLELTLSGRTASSLPMPTATSSNV